MNPLKTGLFHFVGIIAVISAVPSLCFADGLPGEFLLSSRWRDLLSPYSTLTNPAFIGEQNNVLVRGALAPVMQGAFLLWELGVTVPVRNDHAIGVSVIGESDGKIESAIFDETNDRLVAGGKTSRNTNTFIMLSYGTSVWRSLNAGVNCNIAHQSNFGTPLWGVGFDVGCIYRFPENETFGNHRVGIATVNLVAPAMSTSLFKADNTGRYSRDVRLSWNADFLHQYIESGLDIDVKDFWSIKDEFRSYDDIASAKKRLEWGAAWRLGAWFRQMMGGYIQLGFGEQGIEYWGIAVGSRIPEVKKMTNTVLYQFNTKTEGTLASSQTLYVLSEIEKKPQEKQVPASIENQAEKIPADSLKPGTLSDIEGVKIEEEEEYVRITAEEMAIHFASGSADLPPEGRAVLQKIANFLENYPNHPVDIEGHTDSDPITGTLKSKYPDNMALSKARAERVKQYFIEEEHLPQSLFTAKGFGKSRPAEPNTTRENKRKNRRVVIIVKK